MIDLERGNGLILVEGLDNTGKSTLIEHLFWRYPQLRVRPSIGNKHDLDQIKAQAFEEAYGTMPMNTLADRSRIISEYVYNPILNARPIAYDFATWTWFLSGFVQRPQLVIYCWRSVDSIRNSFDEREQLGGVADALETLNMRYEQVMNTLDLMFQLSGISHTVLRYNFEYMPERMLYEFVEQYMATYLKEVS